MTPQRREPGVRRRLRLWWVRNVYREKAAFEADRPPTPGSYAPTYHLPWTSPNSLTKFSFACQHDGHRGARYRDPDRQREKAVR